MSKQQQQEKSVKRARPITAWLKKKENRSDEKEAAENEESSKAKILKQASSLRVYLESLDKNTLSKVVKDQEVQKNSTKTLNEETSNGAKESKTQAEERKNTNPPQGLRRSARNLPPGEKPVEKKVEREPDIEDLPEILFKGRIHYTADFYNCASICDTLLTKVENCQDPTVAIGFDLEWPFSFQTGSGKTALAQICLGEKNCYLIHVYKFQKLPTSFIALLSHPKIKLVGVNIKNDVWKLTRDFKEFPGQKVVDNNCLDCGPYANSVFGRSGRWSLERLTAYLLKKRISKNPKVRKSKWHIHPLSDEQKLYAATDAYVSLLLHLTIEQQEAVILAQEAAAAAAVKANETLKESQN